MIRHGPLTQIDHRPAWSRCSGCSLNPGKRRSLTASARCSASSRTLTRFAIFVFTGHAGQVTPSAVSEEEERELAEASGDDGLDVVPEREPTGYLRSIE